MLLLVLEAVSVACSVVAVLEDRVIVVGDGVLAVPIVIKRKYKK